MQSRLKPALILAATAGALTAGQEIPPPECQYVTYAEQVSGGCIMVVYQQYCEAGVYCDGWWQFCVSELGETYRGSSSCY